MVHQLVPYRLLTVVFVTATLSLAGCGDGGAQSEDTTDGDLVLVPLTNLTVVDEANDPLSSDRPADVDCNELTGWYPEGDGVEVDTGDCNYLALEEPAEISGKAGQTVRTELRHFDLTAAEPAEAHVAFLVDGEVTWETTIAVPGPADVIQVSFPLPKDIEVGAPIGLHLHNHGQNAWTFAPLILQNAAAQ